MFFSGALDYYILHKDGKYVILFLDDHSLEDYCENTSRNICSLFKESLEKNDTTLILEEVVGNVNYSTIFNSKHLEIYSEFYNKHRNNEDLKSIDIRLLLKQNGNVDKFFDKKDDDECMLKVRQVIDRHMSTVGEQYSRLYNEYCYLSKNNLSLGDNKLNLLYPFTVREQDKTWALFYSGMLELYALSCIMDSEKKYVLCYLGAAHCAILYKLLRVHYGYELKRGNKLDLESINEMPYKYFEKLGSMCIKLESGQHID